MFCVLALCGCQRTDSARMDALDKKLDVILQNQAIINQKLDHNIPDYERYIGQFYCSNELAGINMLSLESSNLVNVMAAVEADTVNSVNAETRRVAHIQLDAGKVGTDTQGSSQIEIQHSLEEIKEALNNPADPKLMRVQDDLTDIKLNVNQIKAKLGLY